MNKFNKAKTIGLISASLAGVSLMGVGFASWVVNGSKEDSIGNIQVEVGDVIDNRISITDAKVTEGSSGLKFDAVTPSPAIEGALLTASENSSENLSFTLNYKVHNTTDTNGFTVNAYIVALENKELPKFGDAVAHKYINMPTTLGLSKEKPSTALTKVAGEAKTATGAGVTGNVTGTDGIYSVTQTFTFTWGEAFGNDNPSKLTASSIIYNYESEETEEEKKKEKATQDLVVRHLKDLKTLITSTDGFKVVLVPKVTTNA